MVQLALADSARHRRGRRAATLALLALVAVAAPAFAQSVGTVTGL